MAIALDISKCDDYRWLLWITTYDLCDDKTIRSAYFHDVSAVLVTARWARPGSGWQQDIPCLSLLVIVKHQNKLGGCLS